MSVFLVGGGWAAPADVYGPFLAAAGTDPGIACVVLDEGDGDVQFARFAGALAAAAPCRPFAVLVPLGGQLDPAVLGDADGVLVCGGLTPAYADALAPAAGVLRAWLADGRPYAGFSAGASIAASRAVVGGWLADGVPVCSEDAGEDLDEISVVDGLALVPFAVDVHAAQWGTLPRLISAVARGLVADGLAIDENTLVTYHEGAVTVHGVGQVHRVRPADGGVHVEIIRSASRSSSSVD